MRLSEICRLVWLNLSQNKFKVILTSIGIVVGSATIMMVLAIGTGGRAEVAEQFKNLNAGAIDISYGGGSSGRGFTGGGNSETSASQGGGRSSLGGGTSGAGSGSVPGGTSGAASRTSPGANQGSFSGRTQGTFSGGTQGAFSSGIPGSSVGATQGGAQMQGGSFKFGGGNVSGSFFGGGTQVNEEVILSYEDGQDLMTFVSGISETTISYSATASVEGGDMEASSYYTVAGVLDNYAKLSNLEMAIGAFLSEENNERKEKVCVMGASVAKAIFGSAYEAYDSMVYIDDRAYVVVGVLSEMGTVASGISPDTAIFIPYETGIKYITGTNISPTITVIAENVDFVKDVMADVENVLKESYPNTTFTISDAGSKMEAASASNETLTLLLISMAVIVFIVGGIGIMNVLFVSVKERTNEIGILKALGCSRKSILLEFLLEASCTSLVGAVIGVLLSLGITPLVELLNVRVELSMQGALLSLVFGVITGSIFGFYPAYKASRLVPVVALNQE